MRFSIIYADPPWQYKDRAAAGKRGAVFKYPVLTLKAIRELPVERIASDNSILFLWATFPLLEDALAVIDAWGFKYKTVGFVWVKTNKIAKTLAMGMGNYTRSNAEVCFIGTRGRVKRKRANVQSAIIAPRLAHSAKPKAVRRRIVNLMGDVPRIELFARAKGVTEDGWMCLGFEADGRDIRDSVGGLVSSFDFLDDLGRSM